MGRGLPSRRRGVATVAAILLLTPVTGSASGGCYKGVRPSTTGERTFHVGTLNAIKLALPKPAAGWRVAEETDVRPPRLMCIGQEREPLALEYRIAYRRAVAGASGSADGPAPNESAPDVWVRIDVNPRGVEVGDASETLNVPGTSLALRGGPASSPTVYLFLGDWSIERTGSSSGLAAAHLLSDGPYTRVHALAIRVGGDRADADALAAEIRLDALAALLLR